MPLLQRLKVAPALLLLAALAAFASSAQASPLNAAAGIVDAPGADLPSRAFHVTEGVTDTTFHVSGAPPELVLEPWEEGGGAVLYGELQGDFNADYEMTFTVVTPHGQDSAQCTLRRRDRYVMHTLGLVEGRDSILISLPNPPYVNTWAAVGFVGPITGNADGAMSLGVVPGIAWLQLATGNVHFVSRREFTYSASGAIDPEVGGGTHWGGGSAYDGPPPEMVPLAMMAATVVQARLSQRQTLNRLRVSMDRLGGLWSKFDAVSDSLAAAVARATDHGTLDLIAAELEGLRNTYLTGLNIAAMPARILVPLIPMIEAGVSRYKFMTERGTNGFEALGVAAALQPLDAVGVVGIYEWLSGKEVVTGHDLSEGERALRGSLALLSATPVAASVARAAAPGVAKGFSTLRSVAGRVQFRQTGFGAGIPPVKISLAPKYPDGSFSIIDWSGYPEGVPRPKGPFRLLEGAEYEAALASKNAANQILHRANPALAGLDIHEIHPVKFGGNPTDVANKFALPRSRHVPITNWWNRMQRCLGGKKQ